MNEWTNIENQIENIENLTTTKPERLRGEVLMARRYTNLYVYRPLPQQANLKSTAIKRLSNNKTPEISAEMLKHQQSTISRTCLTVEVLDDWRKGMVVKLPKKGNLSDCNNWRGITLLSTPGKVFWKVLLSRLVSAVNCITAFLDRSNQALSKSLG